MSTLNKVIAYVLYAIALMLVIASLFKGLYLFFGACAYAVMGACMMDTSEKETELEK